MARKIDVEFQERFSCPKCGNKGAQTDRIAVGGTGLSKMFDIQNRYFLGVSCKTCGYTELYNLNLLEKRGIGADILDFLLGS